MNYNIEEFDVVNKFMLYSLDCYIDEVLGDSDDEPEFSAVTLNNIVICYIRLLRKLNTKDVFLSVKDFFIMRGYDESDYLIFKKKLYIESKYYIGKMYNEIDNNQSVDGTVS